MNLNRYRKFSSEVLPAACAILLAASLFANSLNQSQEKPYSLRVPVELVLVPVTVEDGDGKLIAGLQKEDFQLFEEGVPQSITYFSSDPVPLSAVILIDRSTDAGTQSLLKETLLSLIESFSPFDEVAVFQFEHTTDKVQDFTSNKDELLKAFDKITLKGPAPGFGGGPFGGVEASSHQKPRSEESRWKQAKAKCRLQKHSTRIFTMLYSLPRRRYAGATAIAVAVSF